MNLDVVPAFLSAHRSRLGVDTDAAIARDLEMPFALALTWVSKARIHAGLARPPHDPDALAALPPVLHPHADRIGIDADRTVAKAAGVSTGMVRTYRIRLGHGCPHPMRARVEQLRAVLGTRPDDDIATEFGLTRTQVRYHRTMLNIPACPKSVAPRIARAAPVLPPRGVTDLPSWLLPHADQIGVLSDMEIGRRTGKSREIVRLYRHALRRNKAEPLAPDLSSIEDRLGVVHDTVLAKEAAVPVARIRAARVARGLPPVKGAPPSLARAQLGPWMDKLGTCRDRDLAQAAQVSATTVTRLRLQRGIAPYDGERLALGEAVRRLTPYLDKMGVWSDMEIARRADVGTSSVRQLRVRLKIAAAPRTEAVGIALIHRTATPSAPPDGA